MSKEPSDWLQIVITIKSRCFVCEKDISPGQAFWSKSAKTFKHLNCIQKTNPRITSAESIIPQSIQEKQGRNFSSITPQLEELLCFICGAKTGCNECSLVQDCASRLESKYCICDSCAYGSKDMSAAYQTYQQAFLEMMKRSTS